MEGMWSEIGFAWWVFFAFVALFLIGVGLLFRSFRRWQQPRSGRDVEALDAEMKLQTLSKRSGGTWGG